MERNWGKAQKLSKSQLISNYEEVVHPIAEIRKLIKEGETQLALAYSFENAHGKLV
jgi:hypothetical protein